jgi:hypothetical protein
MKKQFLSILAVYFLSLVLVSSADADYSQSAEADCSWKKKSSGDLSKYSQSVGSSCSLKKKNSSDWSKKESKTKCPLLAKFYRKYAFIQENSKTLNLTEEQRTKLEKIKMAIKRNVILKGSARKLFFHDMSSGMNAAKVDSNALGEVIDEFVGKMGKYNKLFITYYADMKALLSKEQWGIAKEIWRQKK